MLLLEFTIEPFVEGRPGPHVLSAIEAAQALHVSPQAFAMTVAIACSAGFVTPVSAPQNMLFMEPGGFRFSDYVKVGLPMLLLTMLVTVALAKVIYLPG